MELCSDIIGKPDLVVCLDSGAGDYKRFWTTTSLRGLVGCSLSVSVLNEGVHSGGASGHVPSSFRIARQLLSRLEDEETGEIKIKELHTNIPDYRKSETEKFVKTLGEEVIHEFPWKDKTQPTTNSLTEGVLRRTWRPALSVVGANGLPPSENAGNVLRPYTKLQLSIRIPPMVDPDLAQKAVVKALSDKTPYDATVVVECEEAAAGWSAPKTSEWLSTAIKKASLEYFNEQDCSMSEGGTIPFMAMLGEKYPNAQFIITGVLGPNSNAHGPNEFLHIPYAKKLTCCIASIINDFN
jgi:acetylornithine deacetylase/succinyl-diaminopimelate desuccinylase-like protein